MVHTKHANYRDWAFNSGCEYKNGWTGPMQKTFDSLNILTKLQQKTKFKTARLSATKTTEKLQYLQSPGSQAWAMPPYIANCGSLPVCAWRYGTLLTLKCKTSPDRASLILLIKEDTLKSNFVLECELMTINGNVMQKGLFIWHRKGCDIQMSKNFVLNIDNIAASLFENKWLSWQIVRWLRQLPQEGVQNLWGAPAH